MQKQRTINLDDSNIAALGSDLHHKLHVASAEKEAAWKGAGQAPGMKVWRIENFKVVPWAHPGTFYDGDSYIVLHTFKKDPKSEKLSHDLFFWLGEFTTQDEYGTAAYKTVELDELLAGVPVQHREVQGHESAAFRTLFPVLSILSGGVESGFNHVKPETFQPRLLHIRKTGKTLAVMQVELKTASLNSGDVFLIDLGKLILQWNGSGSAPGERSSAATIARALDAERKGLATVRVVEETDDDAEVWAALGGKGPIAPAEAPVAAAPHEKRLLRVSDASGKLEISEVARGAAVKRDLCKSEDVFILDLGHEVYAWVGSKTSAQEKAKGLDFAAEFLKKEGRPAHTAIAKIFEGNEPEAFEALH